MMKKKLTNLVVNQPSFSSSSSRRLLVDTSPINAMQHLNTAVAVGRPSRTMTTMMSSRFFFHHSLGGLNCYCSKSIAGKLTENVIGATKRGISSLIQRRRPLFSEQQYLRQFSQQPQQSHPAGTLRPRRGGTKPPSASGSGDDGGGMYFVKAGLPMLLFCGLGVWVMKNGLEGKNRERDAFQGRISKSERQAMMDKEHDDMMEKLKDFTSQEFDNTRRIERPDEVLERRRRERQARNVWYKRWWNKLVNGGSGSGGGSGSAGGGGTDRKQ